MPAGLDLRDLEAPIVQAGWEASHGMSSPPADDGPPNLVDARPLYAGTNVARTEDIRPAAELVTSLTPQRREWIAGLLAGRQAIPAY